MAVCLWDCPQLTLQNHETYEPGSALATSFLYNFSQPVSRWYNHWFWSGGCRSSSSGFASTTGPRNFKLLFGFWSGEVWWIWSSCIQILLEVIAIGISSSPSLKYYINFRFSVIMVTRNQRPLIFSSNLGVWVPSFSWQSRCKIEINVWGHFYMILLFLKYLIDPSLRDAWKKLKRP